MYKLLPSDTDICKTALKKYCRYDQNNDYRSRHLQKIRFSLLKFPLSRDSRLANPFQGLMTSSRFFFQTALTATITRTGYFSLERILSVFTESIRFLRYFVCFVSGFPNHNSDPVPHQNYRYIRSNTVRKPLLLQQFQQQKSRFPRISKIHHRNCMDQLFFRIQTGSKRLRYPQKKTESGLQFYNLRILFFIIG